MTIIHLASFLHPVWNRRDKINLPVHFHEAFGDIAVYLMGATNKAYAAIFHIF
jgi:hypothetical protein